MVPDPGLTIRERAIAAWAPAWHGQNLRHILVTRGYDVHEPWREVPKPWTTLHRCEPARSPPKNRGKLFKQAEPLLGGVARRLLG